MRDPVRLQSRRESAKELTGLDVRNMTPSTRDLLAVLATRRKALAVVAEVPADRPSDAVRIVTADLSALAYAGDERRLVSVASLKPPTIALAPCVSRELAWAARLAGADAVTLPACLAPDEIASVSDAARRTHMLAIVEVDGADEVAPALAAAPRAVLLSAASLAASFPLPCVTIVPAATAEDARALRGVADAVLLSADLTLETDFESLVAELESA